MRTSWITRGATCCFALSLGCAYADHPSFTERLEPFLETYCLDCHDDETQKGGVALDELQGVTEENVDLWRVVWEQVALKEMPPRDKKKQPDLMERHAVSQWITESLGEALQHIGGFEDHQRAAKGNHLDHDLLFNTALPDLAPASTPARIWRIHPQEHLVRLNELISRGPDYDPERPGQRTRGDHISANLQGEIKVYYGLDRYIGHVGGTAAYAASVTGFPPILSTVRDHGLRNYPILYSVNASEAAQLARVAEDILRFMAYGPDAEPFQFADKVSDIPKEHKTGDKRGLPTALFYGKEIRRPLTPVYDLMNEPGVSEERLRSAVDFLFETLTLRPPSHKESDAYLAIVQGAIADLGKEEGAIVGLAPIFLDRDALFRPELAQGKTPDDHGRTMLHGDELALAINAAFSYIQPDAELRTALAEGRLQTREDVRREVARILADDRIRKPRLLQFFREYFDYHLAANVCKDTKALKSAAGNPNRYYAAMNSMVANTDRLVELILSEDVDVLKQLLTTDRVIINPSSDAHYFGNVDQRPPPTPRLERGQTIGPDGKEYPNPKALKTALEDAAQRVHLRTYFTEDPETIYVRQSPFVRGPGAKKLTALRTSDRRGLLTHPSWLVSHSDAMDNHAIHRGKWVRERLLGDAVPDVPITVDAMLPDEPKETLRHRMRVTREDECWRCHQKMDPLGMPFEMYNHIGLLRDKEHGEPVDASGAILLSGEPALDGPVSNALEMIDKLAASERVEQVFVRHVFRFWMGRNETLDDAPILREAHAVYRESGGSMNALLTSLLTSDAFLYRRVE